VRRVEICTPSFPNLEADISVHFRELQEIASDDITLVAE